MSPTQRSLKKARDAGYLAGITEKWVPFPPPGHRSDLFGFIDLIILQGPYTVAIQTTSGSNLSVRLAKIKAEPRAAQWLDGGTRKIVIHGWRKGGPRGKRKVWGCRELEVTADMLNPTKPKIGVAPA
jgi:hypothetical protein